MRILCVEDGSVDMDAIESGKLSNGKVLIYRQGAQKPFILDIPDTYGDNAVINDLEELKTRLQAIINTFKVELPPPGPDDYNNELLIKIINILKMIKSNCIEYIDTKLEEFKNESNDKK